MANYIDKRHIAIGIVALLGVLVSVFIYHTELKHKTSSDKTSTYTIPKTVKYGFTLRNQSNHLVVDVNFWAYAPVAKTATQNCLKIETSIPSKLVTDAYGNQILRFHIESLAPYASRMITVQAHLMMANDPNSTPAVAQSAYLLPEPYIECDHPDIFKKAYELTSNSPFLTAGNICHWVYNHLEYAGYLAQARGALYAMIHKKGDCTEFTYLFAALCRADKIPARGIGGYICRESSILDPEDYHNWAEFYAKDRWHIADPQNNRFAQNNADYIAMCILAPVSNEGKADFSRFGVQGKDLKLKMNRTR